MNIVRCKVNCLPHLIAQWFGPSRQWWGHSDQPRSSFWSRTTIQWDAVSYIHLFKQLSSLAYCSSPLDFYTTLWWTDAHQLSSLRTSGLFQLPEVSRSRIRLELWSTNGRTASDCAFFFKRFFWCNRRCFIVWDIVEVILSSLVLGKCAGLCRILPS